MNRSGIILVLLVAVGLGGVIYSKQKELSDLQRVAASDRTGAQELSDSLAKTKAELEALRKQNADLKSETEQLRKLLADAGKAKSSEGDANATAASGEKKEAGGNFMKGLAKMFTDPEMKKSMRAQQAMGVRMIYGDLLKKLGLSGTDADQFIDILSERQMNLTAEAMSAMSGNDPDKEAKLAKLKDSTGQYDEQLKAVLGEKNYSEFKNYEETMGDRMMMQQWEGQFASAGSPLQGTQKDQLLSLMREERAKTPDSTLINNLNPAQSIEAMRSEEGIDRMLAGQDAVNQRVLSRSRDILNADQIVALDKAQKQQLELMKGQLKMAKEMFK